MRTRIFATLCTGIAILAAPGCVTAPQNQPHSPGGMAAMMQQHCPDCQERGGKDCNCPMMKQGQTAEPAAGEHQDHPAPTAPAHSTPPDEQ